MQFKAIAFSFFAAAAVTAQSNDTSLPDLVSQLPTCAIPCFEKGAAAANCDTTDFACLCGTGKDQFISTASTCVIGDCSGENLSDIISLATQICTSVSENPDPSEVASASNIVTSALGVASATTSPDAAFVHRPDLGVGILGAIVAMLAL